MTFDGRYNYAVPPKRGARAASWTKACRKSKTKEAAIFVFVCEPWFDNGRPDIGAPGRLKTRSRVYADSPCQ